MSVREALEKHQRVTSVAVCLVIVGAVVAIYAQVGPAPHPHVNIAYYTDDDGQTWFEDQVFKMTPFDHNGHEAVGAMVYSLNGKKYVGYMVRFSKKGQDIFSRIAPKADVGPASVSTLAPLFSDPSLHEVKLPGPGHPWVNMRSNAANSIVSPPGGSAGDVQIVNP